MQAADRPTQPPEIRLPGYRVERLVAEGGMASVYLAEQVSLRRRVALKILRQFDEPAEARRFVNEGRIIASLNHRNIITIHDIGRLGDRFYLAMEYLEGGTLSRRIRAGMTPSEALELVAAIAGCLDFVHRRGIVHRDVKPSNILFHADGTPVLTDFGVAKNFGSNQSLTQDGSAVGSPYYLSPEQARSQSLDGRSDIYSLGVICYEMLTGERPFRGASVVDTLLAHIKQPVPELAPPLHALQPLLERMLAKQANDRYDSAQQLLADIGRMQQRVAGIDAAIADTGGGTTDGEATVTLVTAGAPTSHSRVPLYLTALVWVAVLVTGVAGWWQSAQPLPAALADDRPAATGYEVAAAVDPAPPVETAGPPPQPQPVSAARPPTQPVAAIPAAPAETAVSPPQSKPDGASQSSTLPAAVPDVLSAQPPATVATTTPPAAGPAPPARPGTRPSIRPSAPRAAKRSPAANRAKRLLRRAENALREYRLTTPPRHNAHYYFAQLRKHYPRHPALRKAQHRIAEAYADLAEGKLNKFDHEAAQVFVTRGLELESGNQRLRELQQEVRDMRRAQNLFYRAADALFN